jgi:hypothetical protein
MSFGIVAAVVTVASVAYTYTQAKKAQKKAEKAAEAAREASRGTQVPSDLSGGALDIAYGITKVGGYQVFAKTASSVKRDTTNQAHDYTFSSGINFNTAYSGSKNEYLFFQQALTAKGISAVKGLEINDVVITNDSLDILPNAKEMKGYFSLSVSHQGSVTNNFISLNFPERQNASFSGISYLSALFKINRDEPQFNGIPSISLTVEGRKVKQILFSEPNVYSLGVEHFTSNSAEILLDYLLNFANVKSDEVDLESFYKAKVICNKVVDSKIFTGLGYSTPSFKEGYGTAGSNQLFLKNVSGLSVGQFIITSEPGLQNETVITNINTSTNTILINKPLLVNIGSLTSNKIFIVDGIIKQIKLYEFNGLISTEDTHRDNIETIVNSMENAILLWSEGKYKLVLTYPESFEEIPVVASITDDDILVSNISVVWPDIEDKYNNVEITFNNGLENFQSDSVYALEVN